MSKDKLEWTELAGLTESKMASGYPRLMQIMTGQVPTIHTFGILSVDNPMSTQLSPQENNKRRKTFKDKLKQELFGYVQHYGMYDNYEKAFFVPNVRKETVVRWGDTFQQESVIFGTVDHKNQKVTFEFLKDGVTTDVREVVLRVEGGVDNYYSVYKGRKFRIPFFDDNYAPEVKLSYQREELASTENELHLAALEDEADWVRRDAAGEICGMGIMAHRYRVMQALRALKVAE